MKKLVWTVVIVLVAIGIFFAVEYYLFLTQIGLFNDVVAKLEQRRFQEALADCDRAIDYYIIGFPGVAILNKTFGGVTFEPMDRMELFLPKDNCYVIYLIIKIMLTIEDLGWPARNLTAQDIEGFLAETNDICLKITSEDSKQICEFLNTMFTAELGKISNQTAQ